jgi:hypothetical protein
MFLDTIWLHPTKGATICPNINHPIKKKLQQKKKDNKCMVFKHLAFNVNYGRGIIIKTQSMTTTVNK